MYAPSVLYYFQTDSTLLLRVYAWQLNARNSEAMKQLSTDLYGDGLRKGGGGVGEVDSPYKECSAERWEAPFTHNLMSVDASVARCNTFFSRQNNVFM